MSDNLMYVYGSPEYEDEVSYVLMLRKERNVTAPDLLGKAIHDRYLLSLVNLFIGESSACYRMIGEARRGSTCTATATLPKPTTATRRSGNSCISLTRSARNEPTER